MSRSGHLQVTTLSVSNKVGRLVWNAVWLLLYRPSPTPLHAWRRCLLRLFGATVARGAYPYPRAKIWAPWQLSMGKYSCLANDVDCYCVAPITLGERVTVSQYSYLCSASHNYLDPSMPLVTAPITIESEAWIAADVFIGPGVRIGQGAVVGARSTVTKDVEPWTVVAGSPPKTRGLRPCFERH